MSYSRPTQLPVPMHASVQTEFQGELHVAHPCTQEDSDLRSLFPRAILDRPHPRGLMIFLRFLSASIGNRLSSPPALACVLLAESSLLITIFVNAIFMIGWFLENLMRIQREYGLCIFAQSILPGFNKFCAGLVFICLYFSFARGFIDTREHTYIKDPHPVDSPRTPRTPTTKHQILNLQHPLASYLRSRTARICGRQILVTRLQGDYLLSNLF